MSGTSGGESANASRWAAWAAALAGLAVGLVQYRAGVIHLLDTVTYWSGIEAVSRGDLFRTGLAPSFSNFSAAEFAARSGDLPFVDFPIGYPLVAGVFATVLGARNAMRIVCLVSLAVLAVLAVTLDGPSGRSRARATILAVFAALLVTTPAMRLVTQGALSEPLFCAVTVAFVGSVVRFRSHGRAAPMLILGSVVGLLRGHGCWSGARWGQSSWQG